MADINEISPFRIVSTKLLIEIASISPTTLDELKKIKGFGVKRTSRYGRYIIDAINKFHGNSPSDLDKAFNLNTAPIARKKRK